MAFSQYSDDGSTLIKFDENDLVDGQFSVPNSVTRIGDNAFLDCFTLGSINIPDSVTSIDSYAFCGCTDLTSITIPSSVTSIGNKAFFGCSSLHSVVIPNSVTRIGDCAFSCCSSLSSINIPDSVTSIGDGAFRDCFRLSSINIPDSVTSIGVAAFVGCSSLRSINIPGSVTSIGWGAFNGCYNLKYIIVDAETEEEINRIKALLPEGLRAKVVPTKAHEESIKIQADALVRVNLEPSTSPAINVLDRKTIWVNEIERRAGVLMGLPHEIIAMTNNFHETQSYTQAKEEIQEIAFPSDNSSKEITRYKREINAVADRIIESAQEKLKDAALAEPSVPARSGFRRKNLAAT